MDYFLNTTDEYHRHALETLGWELTVCNSLQPKESPCRLLLRSNASFGKHLFEFLERHLPLISLKRVLEVGGGLGYLMKDFLTLAPHVQATMVEISPVLLQKQREELAGLPVEFREMDFLSMPDSELDGFDLAILNENLGDFPTLVFGETAIPDCDHSVAGALEKAADYKRRFSLEFSPDETINIGALEAVEKLCEAGVPYIYLSEHSCEASFSDRNYPRLTFGPSPGPEKISLKGHYEYTIKFSHLEKVARGLGYRVMRGRYIDILPLGLNPKAQTALRAPAAATEKQEIIQQFFYDLHKYEYLLLLNKDKTKDMKSSEKNRTADVT